MGDIAEMYEDDYYNLDDWVEDEQGVTCCYCGADGLEWAFTGSRWVLMNDDGAPHVCNRTASPDDFDDIS